MAINTLIEDFSVNALKEFFYEKINTFKLDDEDYEYLFEDNEAITANYQDIKKIGEADLSDTDDILVFTAKTLTALTTRTGKKKQYEIAKKILKEENKDAAIFVFYDSKRNFRFSLIRANFLGSKRDFTDFKRYTYFVSHEFTNKTFIKQIGKCDFNRLDSIQEAFSVEPITKQFYEKLQRWYFWAIQNVKFPDDAEKETNGRKVAIIRLITRLMFIWFMKVRNLIPNELFNEENISKILKDFSADESTYYKAILQNLFFATLNTKQEERKFRSEIRGHKGYNPDFGNHNVFHYHALFENTESLEKLFGKIPFLNGGLFECLDYKAKDKNERKYIDGFTATKEQQPKIPNFLFFSETRKADISNFFGTANKTYEVEGLINLLNSYNFTIDENEPDDIEVALDPELLGSIFENLLASYNPETATTARKATGSFYTPREIVNYMTNESLKQYFKTHLAATNAQTIEEKIDALLNDNVEDNPFDEKTTKQIISLVNNLRVVDPAVGSGAFPMAMLNKLVFILSKLDPENKHWKQSQIDGVKKSVSDAVLQRKLIEQIERQFKEKNADYGRKLYLIRKCIYGVDSQQIAVEIAKLRFFISLLVDEKIDFDKPNYGIEPLPNLDFKLIQGNSLISTYAGIDFGEKNYVPIINEKRNELKHLKKLREDVESDFFKIYNKEHRQDKTLKKKLDDIAKKINTLEKQITKLEADRDKDTSEQHKKLIKKFEELKQQYQNESDVHKKQDLRKNIDNAIIKIFEEKISQHIPQLKAIEEKAKSFPNEKQREKYIAEEKKKLTQKLGFDIEQIEKDLIAYTEGRKAKDFFLWNVYFAEVFFDSHEYTDKNIRAFVARENNSHEYTNKKSGFDIVIGNPPYIQLQKATNGKQKFADLYKNENFKTFERTGDIYALFYEKGINILTENGLLCYITSNKWMRANYGKSLRNFLSKNNPLKLIDLGPGVFNTATVDTNILLLQKIRAFVAKENDSHEYTNKNKKLQAITFTQNNKKDIAKLADSDFTTLTELSEDSWIILSPAEQRIKQKIERIGTPLKDWDIKISYGIRTGLNQAFIIDGKIKEELIAKDPKSAEIIKPILRGRDIKRYKAEFADLWIILVKKDFHNEFRKSYSKLYEYVAQYEKELKNRGQVRNNSHHWIEIDNSPTDKYLKEFEKEKIVWKRIGSVIRFSYSVMGELCLDSTVIGTGNRIKYLTALLNSRLLIRELLLNSPKTGTGDVIISVQALNPLLVHIPNNKIAKLFETHVDKIIAKKERGEDTTAEEQKIDIMVYKLYDLTYEEVKIIEPEFALTKEEYVNYS